MAILMVFTILPTNFTSVGAESEFTICLDLHDIDESVLDSSKLNINIMNEDENEIDGIKYEIKKKLTTNIYKVVISGFTDEKIIV